MLQPKRTKFRKQFKGRNRGLAQRTASRPLRAAGLPPARSRPPGGP
jgi:ribosomal protein L16/L10AE